MPSADTGHSSAYLKRTKDPSLRSMLVDVLGQKKYDKGKEEARSKKVTEIYNRLDPNSEEYSAFARHEYEYQIERLHDSLLTDISFFKEEYEKYIHKNGAIANNISKFVESINALNKIRESKNAFTKRNIYYTWQLVDKSLKYLDSIYGLKQKHGLLDESKDFIYKFYAGDISEISKYLYHYEGIRQRKIAERDISEIDALSKQLENLKRAEAHGAYNTNPKIYDQIAEVEFKIQEYYDSLPVSYDWIRDEVNDLEKAAEEAETPEEVIAVEQNAVEVIAPIIESTPKAVGARYYINAFKNIASKGTENQKRVDKRNKEINDKCIKDEKERMAKERKKIGSSISDINIKKAQNQRRIDNYKKKLRKKDMADRRRQIEDYYKNHVFEHIQVVYPDATIDVLKIVNKNKEEVAKVFKKVNGKYSVPLKPDMSGKWEELFKQGGTIESGQPAISLEEVVGGILSEETLAKLIKEEMEQEQGGDPTTPEVSPDVYRSITMSSALIEFGTAFDGIMATITSSINSFRECVDTIYSDILPKIEDFKEIFDAPLDAVIKVLSVGISALYMSSNGINASISLFCKTAELVTGSKSKKDDEDDDEEENEDDKPLTVIGTLFVNLGRFLALVLAHMGFAIKTIQSVITFGLSSFTNIMDSILGLVKAIAKTSPLIDQIANMLNLALIIFALPFTIAFSNQTLTNIIQTILYIRDEGLSRLFFWQNNDEAVEKIRQFYILHEEKIKEIATTFIEDVLPDLILFMADVFVFTTYFMESLLKDSSRIIDVLKAGIQAANSLIDSGFITSFLTASIAFLEFFKDNAAYILGVLSTGFNVMKWCLNHTDEIMRHFRLFCDVVGGAVGTVLGVIVGGKLFNKVLKKFFGDLSKKEALKLVPALKDYRKRTLLKNAFLGGTIGVVVADMLYNYLFAFGKGGFIPATPGGMLAIVAEKETEYIIPSSKIHLMQDRKKVILNFNGNVYGMDSSGRQIQSAISYISDFSEYR